ncbi:MAG TPA: hypothetical protein VEJ36_02370 [Nitrososphaerales archaeon]|nr:hypothetical protein [Nitrososphaerales archaeon]
MPLRVVAVLSLILLLLAPGALAQTTTYPSKLVQISEPLPWFDQKGVNFSYDLQGSFPGLRGQQTYLGSASVSVLGIASNESLELSASSTTANAFFPNGTLYDDPFFPSYAQVLPLAFVIPRTFTVLAPTYGLTFKFLGNITTEFAGETVIAYAYSVSAMGSGQEQSQIVKYYRVLPSNGLVIEEELTNTETDSTLNMTLVDLRRPGANLSTPLQFSIPSFAAPGDYIEYRNTGVGNQTIRYTSLFAESDGLFTYERTVRGNGTSLGVQFFLDKYTNPDFYPASTEFSNTIDFPVAVGSLERGVLTLKGQTSVDTPYGYFNTRSYANQTIGFEAYLDDNTGVAVYVELPGGFLQLAASNFLTPVPPPQQSELIPITVLALFTALVIILVFLHFRKSPRRPKHR